MKRTPLKRTGPIKRKGKSIKSTLPKPTAKKIKSCQECGYRGRIWSAGLCRKCAEAKRRLPPIDGTVTVEMVDQVFSWLVRTLYPNFCHACKQALPYKLLQCCHMVPRGNMIVRWDLRDCYPGCQSCNFHDPTHEILLAAECDRYWGVGTAEKLALEGKKAYHWAPYELEELYQIFREALEEAQAPGADKNAIRIKTLAKTRRAA
jgi:hypothetical protein